MNLFLKILTTIFLVIWIVIGTAVLVGGFAAAVFVAHYAPVATGFFNGQGSGAMMQRFADPAQRSAAWQNLSVAQRLCLQHAIGATELQRALTEQNYEPSPDVLIQGASCLH